jgi:hypothetical protein
MESWLIKRHSSTHVFQDRLSSRIFLCFAQIYSGMWITFPSIGICKDDIRIQPDKKSYHILMESWLTKCHSSTCYTIFKIEYLHELSFVSHKSTQEYESTFPSIGMYKIDIRRQPHKKVISAGKSWVPYSCHSMTICQRRWISWVRDRGVHTGGPQMYGVPICTSRTVH